MRVIGCQGCGSVIVEAALVLCGVAYEREEVDYEKSSPERDRLLTMNPLGQVPTVILDDGTVMTESAAIILHLDDEHPGAKLLPPIGDPLRPVALRWLIFFVGALYPTFTYGDHPRRWVTNGDELRRATDTHRETLWRQVEATARGPYFLGDRRSILDVYIAVMTRWRPRRDWFALHGRKLLAIATTLDADPRLAQVIHTSFTGCV